MSTKDCRGVPVSTGSAKALAAYERALTSLNSYFGDPVAAIEAALAEEPDFVMSHLLRAGCIAMATQKDLEPELRKSVEAAEALAQKANARERGHMRAARAWLDGDFAGATELWGGVAIEHPRDLLAVQFSHLGDFFNGSSSLLRDRVARVLPCWDKSVPGHGYVLGMYAFGLEEMGEYARAEETALQALALNRRDPWAIHAVAHVCEMQARLADGIRFLTARTEDWAPDNAFAFHNWWHLGLYFVDIGDTARALALYDTRIRPKQTGVALEMVDASAILWRLTLLGADVGRRWAPLAECWAPMLEDGYYAFNDCHALMALIGADRIAEAERVLAALEKAARGGGTNARMAGDVGVPLAKGLLAFGRGDYGGAIAAIMPIRHIANRFGGSHAQRDLLAMTLIEAALRGDNKPLARALAAERLANKSQSPLALQFTARQRRGAGEFAGAAAAQRAAENLAAAVKREAAVAAAA
ncbi:MAG TPA: tetratricopeptide repeat protein [Alphaproteobacteria bacterium]